MTAHDFWLRIERSGARWVGRRRARHRAADFWHGMVVVAHRLSGVVHRPQGPGRTGHDRRTRAAEDSVPTGQRRHRDPRRQRHPARHASQVDGARPAPARRGRPRTVQQHRLRHDRVRAEDQTTSGHCKANSRAPFSRCRRVREVRVLLALPEQGLFKQATSKPKASVTIALHQGQALRAEQVRGIQRLVAASVPGMTTQDVTLVDGQGLGPDALAHDLDRRRRRWRPARPEARHRGLSRAQGVGRPRSRGRPWPGARQRGRHPRHGPDPHHHRRRGSRGCTSRPAVDGRRGAGAGNPERRRVVGRPHARRRRFARRQHPTRCRICGRPSGGAVGRPARLDPAPASRGGGGARSARCGAPGATRKNRRRGCRHGARSRGRGGGAIDGAGAAPIERRARCLRYRNLGRNDWPIARRKLPSPSCQASTTRVCVAQDGPWRAGVLLLCLLLGAGAMRRGIAQQHSRERPLSAAERASALARVEGWMRARPRTSHDDVPGRPPTGRPRSDSRLHPPGRRSKRHPPGGIADARDAARRQGVVVAVPVCVTRHAKSSNPSWPN